MIPFGLYLKVCRIELMVRVEKLILHYYVKVTSLGNTHINKNYKRAPFFNFSI